MRSDARRVLPRSVTAGIIFGLIGPVAALAQSNGGDPSIRTRIGNPETGGSYRWDLGQRIGPAETSGRRPFSLQDRISPDEGIERRPAGPERARPAAPMPSVLVTVGGKEQATVAPGTPVDSIKAAGEAFRRCLMRPEVGAAEQRSVSLRLALRRDGSLIGPPRLVASTPKADAPGQGAAIAAARRAIERCAPLPVTARFGSSMAGRPFTMRFIFGREP